MTSLSYDRIFCLESPNIDGTYQRYNHYFRQIYLYTYKSLVTLIDCMFEAVRTTPGYEMATLIHNFWDF